MTSGGRNPKKWERIQPGDVTLLASKGRIFASAVTTYKLHNPDLARSLWGTDEKGQTWEYIYFVDEVVDQSIPYSEFNRAVPYKHNNVIQGFDVLDEEKSENVLSAFDLRSETFFPSPDFGEIKNALLEEEELDAPTKGMSRREQAAIRRELFQNRPLGNCCLCGELFPVTLLVAAHIKKRSQCTTKEKLDFGNIAAPMCRFGCDELYERGILGVSGGTIIRLSPKLQTEVVERYLKNVVGRTCSHWSPTSSNYFEWHTKNRRRDS